MSLPGKSRKLKVFQTHIGFYEVVIASPSQTAALRAWGINQNLFANGMASISTDKAAISAALQHPGTPLRRAVGSREPFRLIEPTTLPRIPKSRNQKINGTLAGTTPLPKRAPVDRSKLDAAEAKLKAIEERRKIEEAELDREEEALAAKRATAQRMYVGAVKETKGELTAARIAYRRAGGQH